MRFILIISFFLLLQLSAFSQKLSDNTFWLSLKDKKGSSFSLTSPEAFLSAKSIDRRFKQNIALLEEDLPVSRLYLDSLSNLGLTILGSSHWFNAVIIESSDTLLLDTLDHISFVSEFNYKIPRKKAVKNSRGASEKHKFYEVADSFISLDYGLGYSQISMLKGLSLHSAGFLGDDIRIAVIDGGFYHANTIAAFDSLWMDGRMLGYMDFTRSGPDFYSTASHGMTVLSTMAANLPGDMIGTAPNASYYLLKSEIVESETPLEEALWVLAAEFADSAGVDIITSSLGYSEFDDPALDYSYVDMDGKTALVTRAAEKAFSKGMIVVISAGNSGNKSWKYLTAPSDGPNVLAIGATDTSGRVAAFSSRGPSFDQRVKPDLLAVGYKTIVVNASGDLVQGYGTSFSAPQIAGMMACLWQAAPEKTNVELISAVRRSASHFYSPNDSAGYGIPDFKVALMLLNSSDNKLPSDHLKVFPNPNSGTFEIYSDKLSTSFVKVSIYNQLGEIVFSGDKSFPGGYSAITELEGYGSGFYFIVAESGGKKYKNSFVISRQ